MLHFCKSNLCGLNRLDERKRGESKAVKKSMRGAGIDRAEKLAIIGDRTIE